MSDETWICWAVDFDSMPFHRHCSAIIMLPFQSFFRSYYTFTTQDCISDRNHSRQAFLMENRIANSICRITDILMQTTSHHDTTLTWTSFIFKLTFFATISTPTFQPSFQLPSNHETHYWAQSIHSTENHTICNLLTFNSEPFGSSYWTCRRRCTCQLFAEQLQVRFTGVFKL